MSEFASRWSRRGLLTGAAALSTSVACRSAGSADAARADSPKARERLDERLGELVDARPPLAPIGEAERSPRRAKLAAALARAGFQALLCEPGPTMSWLAGIDWHRSERAFLLILLADGSVQWLVPAFEESKARLYLEKAGHRGPVVHTWAEHEYAFAPLAAILRAARVERAAIEPQMRYFLADRLGAEFGRERLESGAALVRELRSAKEPRELELIGRANELTKQALRRVAEVIHAGCSSGEIAALVSRAQERLGLVSPWNLTLVGAAAALPHGDTSSQIVGRDDLLLVDTGGTYLGYQSDVTRTWVVEGRGRERELRAWNSVRAAQRRAFEAIRPGVECREIDRVARRSLADDGWGDGYAALTHRLGHGIGLEGHEDPYFDGGSTVALAQGMTLSDEPGIYVPGEFGVRIEDIVAVTADGATVFGPWQSEPTSPA